MSSSLILLGLLLIVPVIALIAAVLCRRHRVLLWLGGPVVVLLGPFVLWLTLSDIRKGELGLAVLMLTYAALPILAAGAILVVGGLLRWHQVWRKSQPVPPGELPGPPMGSF